MDVPAKGNVLGRVVPARYILAILGSVGMAIVYGLKVNLSVAMVGMLNHTAIKMSAHGSLEQHQQAAPTAEVECQPTSNATDSKCANLSPERLRSMDDVGKRAWRCLECRSKHPKADNTNTPVRKMASTLTAYDAPGTDSDHSNVTLRRKQESNTKSISENTLRGLLKAERQEITNIIQASVNGISDQLNSITSQCSDFQESLTFVSGRVAELFSAKWVMFFSVCINVVCTLLTPVMAEAHYVAVVLMRIGEGIGGGVTFPAMHVLLSKWAPPVERSVMAALVYAGTSLGTVMSMLMAGVLTATLGNFHFGTGWESVFYVMGGLSCLWCVLWVFLVQDSPGQQPLISKEERDFIVTSLGGNNDKSHKNMSVPWKQVFTSGPFLAIVVAHACSNWGWYMLLIELPFYMKQVLKFNMTENAVTTALPFLSLWFFSMGLSKTLDTLREKNIITTTTAR
ncbi:unnamed protein product [Leptidea sinapis]|uniref:Major facilitator superfamily (MFS) profile domain-containing protein n=1 Tax=Leptidea sinapis TaxID=189913 RepID=A0A5E4PRN4_9NEOP|nr:unnamed protein product [Leptidea sinapis]